MSNCVPIISLLEDDTFQISDFQTAFQKYIGNVSLESITCEAEFLDRYEVKPPDMPDLFVLDLMVVWQQPWVNTKRCPTITPPQETAAIRCLRSIRVYDPIVPVIVYTMIDTENLDMNIFDERTILYRKEVKDEFLIDVIKKLLRQASSKSSS